jgi:nitrite reductase/ring-hydroxylating ferredoxin subunit
MSDIASPSILKQSTPQLPVSWYFEQRMLELEQKLLFQNGPGYIGHELMVPNLGDYHTLAWMDHAKVLVRNPRGVELLSNICRHRQAIMLEGRGNARVIVCPLHRWTYDTRGVLLGAPHFPSAPASSLHQTGSELERLAVRRRAMSPRTRAELSKPISFSGTYSTGKSTCNYNWKTFIEVYLRGLPRRLPSQVGQFCHRRYRWQFMNATRRKPNLNQRLSKLARRPTRLAQSSARLLRGRVRAAARSGSRLPNIAIVVSARAGGEHPAPARTQTANRSNSTIRKSCAAEREYVEAERARTGKRDRGR